jgi:hypothetical protein
MELERRPYGPDCTPAEREAIRARVQLVEDGIVLAREMPVASTYSLELMFERECELAARFERFALVVDVSDTAAPGAEERAKIKQLALAIPGLVGIHVVTGKNVAVNVVAKMLMGLLFRNVKPNVYGSVEQALAAARRNLAPG